MNPEIYKSQSNLTPICKVIKDNQIHRDYDNPFKSLGSKIVFSGSFSDRTELTRSKTDIGRISPNKMNCIQKALALQSLNKITDSKIFGLYQTSQYSPNNNLQLHKQEFLDQRNYSSKFVNFEYVQELRKRKRANTFALGKSGK